MKNMIACSGHLEYQESNGLGNPGLESNRDNKVPPNRQGSPNDLKKTIQ